MLGTTCSLIDNLTVGGRASYKIHRSLAVVVAERVASPEVIWCSSQDSLCSSAGTAASAAPALELFPVSPTFFPNCEPLSKLGSRSPNRESISALEGPSSTLVGTVLLDPLPLLQTSEQND